MLVRGAIGGVFACFSGCALAGEAGERLVFATAEPQLVRHDEIAQGLLSAEQYSSFAENVGGLDHMVPVRELPATSLPLLGYGINFVLDGINRGFAVFGGPGDGYRLYADLDADGRLADEAGWPLEADGEGRYSVAFDTVETGQAGGKPVAFPIRSRFVVVPGDGDDGGRARGVWNSDTVRSGDIRVDGRTVPFELFGRGGRYDDPNSVIWFDLDADGAGGETARSPERFRVLDEYVTIGERSYAFRVDPYGRHLTLIPEAETRDGRPPLANGEPAPAFETTTVDDGSIALADHRGRFVLLNFWAAWCGPCVDEAPRLAEIHDRWGESGLEIVGVTTDSPERIEEFANAHPLVGPQISEAFEGPVHRAYRVSAYPTKYLVDRDGHLVCGGPGPSFWEDCWPTAKSALQARTD